MSSTQKLESQCVCGLISTQLMIGGNYRYILYICSSDRAMLSFSRIE